MSTVRCRAHDRRGVPGPRFAGRSAQSLVEGEVIVNDPSWLHQRVQANLLYALETWVPASLGRGHVTLPIDVQLDDRNVYKPDLLW